MYRRLWGPLAVALLAALCLAPAGAWAEDVGGVQINEANFPDYTFREDYVRTYDKDNDGYLSDAEIAGVTGIMCGKKGISSLKGIEYFTALKYLNCYLNDLTSLDLGANTALEELNCSSNKLTALDVSNNTKLELLYCRYNELTSLNVNNCSALSMLSCYNNKLESLDVSSNARLETLLCDDNALTSLDVSSNVALRKLNCSSNNLGTLDVRNDTALEELTCYSNDLVSLDVSHNVALRKLGCYNNNLSTLDVRNNTALEELTCYSNDLASLDVSHNVALRELGCSYNQLGALDVSHNSALKELSCSYNNLTSLDVGNNAELEDLNCQNNNLTSLDVGRNGALKSLHCNGNSYAITIDTGRQFDLSGLPGSFSAGNASGWNGGSVTDGVLTVNGDATSVSYSYYCGAMWAERFTLNVNYVVSFDTGGGSAVDGQTVAAGGKAARPESAPTLVGYVFEGWCADEECAQEYDFDSAVTEATTVYAKWVEDSVAPAVSGIGGGKTYCAAQKATVSDDHLASVTLDGSDVVLVEGQTSCELDLLATGLHTIVAADKAGNITTVAVTVNDGHTWSEAWSYDATGHWHECSVCGEKKDAAEHSGGTATCSMKAVCDTCGAEYGKLNPKKHEALEHVEAKEATTEAEGNMEYWRCTGCGKLFSDEAATKEVSEADTVIPKKDEKKGDKSNSALPKTGDESLPAALPLAAGLSALTLAVLSKHRDA